MAKIIINESILIDSRTAIFALSNECYPTPAMQQGLSKVLALTQDAINTAIELDNKHPLMTACFDLLNVLEAESSPNATTERLRLCDALNEVIYG